MALSPGHQIGPYEVVDRLGSGGMGEVYRARDPRLGRQVAVKVLPTSLETDPDRLRRFELEARAASALNHPNIVVIFDVGHEKGAPYIVSELLEGSTLREFEADKALPLRKALEIASQIAEALAAAHDHSIIHRDLKPENIFVTRDGRVKLLDFGLAKAMPHAGGSNGTGGHGSTLPADTASGTVFGTAGYMAPEQVRGQPADHRSDIFAFGAILYELLSGHRAFDGASPLEKAYSIINDDPLPLGPSGSGRVVPAAVERIVWRCLEKDPAERFQSARDLAFDLRELPERLAAAPAVSGAAAAVPARGRSGALLLVGATVLLAGLAFVGGRWTRTPPAAGAIASAPTRPPHYRRITFRQGSVGSARFTGDSNMIYTAASSTEMAKVFTSMPGNPEARPLTGPRTALLAFSAATGEMALALYPEERHGKMGILASAQLAGGAPRQLLEDVAYADWSPDGKQLAVVRWVDGMTRLEYPIGKVLYESHGAVTHLRVSPRGDWLAFLDHPVSNDTRGTVNVIPTGDPGKRRTLTAAYADINGLAWSPSGDEVWFTASETSLADSVRAVTLDGAQRILIEAPGNIQLEDVARDGRVLLRRADKRMRIVVRAPGETRERDLSWFDGSMPVDWSLDGKQVLFIEGFDAAWTEIVSYMRPTDGSPAVRLGGGWSFALSPDARWALMSPRYPYDKVILLPTGAGEPRPLPAGPLVEYRAGSWFPDGKRVLMLAREADHKMRLWVQDVSGGGPPRAVSKEDRYTCGHAISPDGKTVAAFDRNGHSWLIPVDGGGEERELVGAGAERVPVGWSDDGRAVFLAQTRPRKPTQISRFDLATGHQTPWLTIDPADASTTMHSRDIFLTSDGKSYLAGYQHDQSDLYLVEGLR